MPRSLRLDADGRLKLSEADVIRQVVDFLEIRGWAVYKTGYGEITRDGRVVEVVGEAGIPDRLAVRYSTGAYAEVMWLEFKRPKSKGDQGGKLRDKQIKWRDEATRRGAVCCVPDNLERFEGWYAATIGPR